MSPEVSFLPAIYNQTLANQMRVVGMEYTRTPWVSLTYMAKRGAEANTRARLTRLTCPVAPR